jgi:hypothetical protein
VTGSGLRGIVVEERLSEAVVTQHRLTLLGGRPGELRVSADALQEMLAALMEGARQATRFVVEGQSVRRGTKPAWLDAACQVEITQLSGGSTVVSLDAPTLEEAAPDRFGRGGQGVLFEDPDAEVAKHTAVELFGSVLASVVEGPVDDVMADRGLLATCARFAAAAGAFEGARLEGLTGRDAPLVVGGEHVATIQRLRDETPGSQVPQDERSGVAAFFGTWPGDESEQELLDALRALG